MYTAHYFSRVPPDEEVPSALPGDVQWVPRHPCCMRTATLDLLLHTGLHRSVEHNEKLRSTDVQLYPPEGCAAPADYTTDTCALLSTDASLPRVAGTAQYPTTVAAPSLRCKRVPVWRPGRDHSRGHHASHYMEYRSTLPTMLVVAYAYSITCSSMLPIILIACLALCLGIGGHHLILMMCITTVMCYIAILPSAHTGMHNG